MLNLTSLSITVLSFYRGKHCSVHLSCILVRHSVAAWQTPKMPSLRIISLQYGTLSFYFQTEEVIFFAGVDNTED